MFFRNLNHMMEGKEGLEKSLFQAALIFYHGDLRPAFPWHSPWLEKIVSDNIILQHKSARNTHLSGLLQFVIIVGGHLAPLLGYKLKYNAKAKSL